MVGSETDLKYLGNFAQLLQDENPPLSAALYRLLGLSTLLSRKLIRARKQRRLDPSRDTKSHDLHRHIIWMSREGLGLLLGHVMPHVPVDAPADGSVPRYVRVTRAGSRAAGSSRAGSRAASRAGSQRSEDLMGETAMLPEDWSEMKVLCLKLKAGFLYIFELFNFSYTQSRTLLSTPSMIGIDFMQTPTATPSPRANGAASRADSIATNPFAAATGETSHAAAANGINGMTGYTSDSPPLGSHSPRSGSGGSYVLATSQAFKSADDTAAALLPGSHPLRLSVKVEYAAFVYDCMHEVELSRKIARRAVDEAFKSMEAMDDDAFEEAMELVQHLGVMIRRGMKESPPQPTAEDGQRQQFQQRPPPAARSDGASAPIGHHGQYDRHAVV